MGLGWTSSSWICSNKFLKLGYFSPESMVNPFGFAGASLLLKSHLLVGQAAHFGETSQHIPTLVSYIKLYKHYKPQVSNFLSSFLVGYFLYISIVFSVASLLLKLAEVQWRRVAVGGWRYSCSGQGRSGSERFGYPSGGRRFFPFQSLRNIHHHHHQQRINYPYFVWPVWQIVFQVEID